MVKRTSSETAKQFISFLLILLLSLIVYNLRTPLSEESYIAFRYARNIAAGGGIVYNLGDSPSHGFSSLVWTLFCSILYELKLHPETTINKINLILFGVFIWFFFLKRNFSLLTILFILPLIFFDFFIFCDLFSGSEIVLYSLLALSAILFFDSGRSNFSFFLAGLAAFIKSEGVILLLFIAIAEFKRSPKKALLYPIFFICGLLALNYFLFESLIPNYIQAAIFNAQPQLIEKFNLITVSLENNGAIILPYVVFLISLLLGNLKATTPLIYSWLSFNLLGFLFFSCPFDLKFNLMPTSLTVLCLGSESLITKIYNLRYVVKVRKLAIVLFFSFCLFVNFQFFIKNQNLIQSQDVYLLIADNYLEKIGSGESALVESEGRIAFYLQQAKFLDWSGRTSKEILEFRRQFKNSLSSEPFLIYLMARKPDWIIIPRQLIGARQATANKWFIDNYIFEDLYTPHYRGGIVIYRAIKHPILRYHTD
ncbi:MAG TPA: hypothetical protein PKD37_02625 [Oligoflexia bacterium]|nr:hypothetical protein [Oligoflexia bacterium]HMP26865.1 hypothetical protein [Oligoflexia bacterium]